MLQATNESRPKVIVVVGPTASGKSELAVYIAKKFQGEIISADSRQVYKGLNIGTGKVKGEWQDGYRFTGKKLKVFVYKSVPHYCIDFVSPKKTYSVAEFKKCAQKSITDVWQRDKVPIIAGGTAFWIDALVYDLNIPPVEPNKRLREKLSQKPAKQLLEILGKLDPQRAQTIEQKNPRRLIRAIEIAKALGRVPTAKKSSPYDALWLGIKLSESELEKKIKLRLKKRFKEGMLDEVKYLHQKGLSWKKLYEFGLEYRLISEYLRSKIDRNELERKLEQKIKQYAKRQLSWWKRNKEIHWIDAKKEAVIKIISKWLRQ